MGFIRNQLRENASDLVKYHHAPKFAPAGQSTQMIIGATPDTDYQILNLTEGLYQKYKLKRVFYSAYLPVNESALLPPIGTKPPLLREHRLYQADWLLRFYGFKAKELLDEQHQSFHPYLDPKCNWALNHLDLFPVEDVYKRQAPLTVGCGSAMAYEMDLVRFHNYSPFDLLFRQISYFSL